MTTENKQPDERAAFPNEPRRPDYNSADVRFGECEHCSKRAHLLPRDNAMICGSCADAEHIGEWMEYAAKLRAMLARATTQQANKGDERAACHCGVQCRDYGKEICRYHHDDAALGRLYREYFDQIHPEEVCRVVNERAAAPQAVTLDGGRDIWEYSFIHSSALGRPDEKVTLLTYDKDTAFRDTCFDQKLVCSDGIAIAEVCEDSNGFKHVAEIVEELDDIPAGTKLYALAAAPQAVALSDEQIIEIWENRPVPTEFTDKQLRDPIENFKAALLIFARALLAAHPTEQRMSDAEQQPKNVLTADDADMVWATDDGETFFHTIDDAVDYEVDQAWPTTGPLELKLSLGKRIPSATVRIFNITENGHEWEIVDAARKGDSQ